MTNPSVPVCALLWMYLCVQMLVDVPCPVLCCAQLMALTRGLASAMVLALSLGPQSTSLRAQQQLLAYSSFLSHLKLASVSVSVHNLLVSELN